MSTPAAGEGAEEYIGEVPRETAPGLPLQQVVAFAVMVGFFAMAPFFVYPVFLMKALCFALFACAFNLLIGYVGLLSFGHAAFLFGTAVACGLGMLIGALAIRSRGIYFANITLALAQMIYFFCLQAKFTGGEDGIQAVPRGVLLGLLDLHN